MAMTTRAAFDEFESLIALTANQKATVKTRTGTIRQLLTETFPASDITPLSSSTLIGSADRGTIIRPLDDIDVLAVFANKDGVFETYRYDSQQFLYRVTNSIKAKTQVLTVGSRGQAIRLFYTDGLHVDIAPVFSWNSSGFALPAGDGTWITTDPAEQAKWANQRQSDLNGQFKPVVRLMKRWNAVHSRRVASFHMEVIVGNVFTSIGTNHRETLAKFFEWAQSYLHVTDPAGHGGDLGAGLTYQQQQDVVNSMARSRERATRAVTAETNGDHEEAIRLWRIILGGEFPSYG